MKISADFYEDIINSYISGESCINLAKKYNVDHRNIKRILKKNNIVIRNTGSRDFLINDTVFDNIDNEDKAYWFGFILADGMIGKSAGTRRSFKLGLQKRDEKHVKKLAEFFGHKGKLHFDTRNGHARVTLLFNSVYLCNKLCEMGWLEFKNKGCSDIIKYVPNSLFNHFIRGYFDGDGCISQNINAKKNTWYMNIVCQYFDILNCFNDRINNIINIKGYIKKRKTVYLLYWIKNDSLNKLINWMYKNSSIFLIRKTFKCFSILNDSNLPYKFNSIQSFAFSINTNDFSGRSDKENIMESFLNCLISSGWSNSRYNFNKDFNLLKNFDCSKCVGDDCIKQVNGKTYGNEVILHFNPIIWSISQSKKPPIASLSDHIDIVKRALNRFFNQPDSVLTPNRLIRELLFAGFSKASILSVPVIVALLSKLNLNGIWFDPCAGWGNRMLAANICGIEYYGTDPGICWGGLLNMKNSLNLKADLQHKRWQDCEWVNCDFVFTSFPFWNKEDYLDNFNYGDFEFWYNDFVIKLINKAAIYSSVIVFHVDNVIKNYLLKDFSCDVVPLVGNRASPDEFFVKINKC